MAIRASPATTMSLRTLRVAILPCEMGRCSHRIHKRRLSSPSMSPTGDCNRNHRRSSNRLRHNLLRRRIHGIPQSHSLSSNCRILHQKRSHLMFPSRLLHPLSSNNPLHMAYHQLFPRCCHRFQHLSMVSCRRHPCQDTRILCEQSGIIPIAPAHAS